jgi:hypothetical protein
MHSKIHTIIAIVHLSAAEPRAKLEASVLLRKLHPDNVFGHKRIHLLKSRMAALLDESAPEHQPCAHLDTASLGPASQRLQQLLGDYKTQSTAVNFTQEMFPLSAEAGKLTELERKGV